MAADHTFQKMTFMYECGKILVKISILKQCRIKAILYLIYSYTISKCWCLWLSHEIWRLFLIFSCLLRWICPHPIAVTCKELSHSAIFKGTWLTTDAGRGYVSFVPKHSGNTSNIYSVAWFWRYLSSWEALLLWAVPQKSTGHLSKHQITWNKVSWPKCKVLKLHR